MPHCIIEYSKGIEPIVDVSTLVSVVYQGALSSALFTPEDIKCRAIPYAHYHSGGDRVDFIHVVLKILQGRDTQQKADLSSHVLTALELLPLTNISLTVEVVDIVTSSYQKTVRD
jgi:5-carboxymethyl-2-hydroxymuconate isomerase